MFNIRHPTYKYCSNKEVFMGNPSYIHSVKWNDFMANPNFHIDTALQIKENWNEYDIVKQVI